MSQFYTPFFRSIFDSKQRWFVAGWVFFALFFNLPTIAQTQIPENNQVITQTNPTNSSPQPFLGGYGAIDPPRLSTNAGYDPLNPQISDSLAAPFLSFLIIEPDPSIKNGIPSEIEKSLKAKKYTEAISQIDAQLKKTPQNIQLRFIKTRIQIELRQFELAKKTLLEITQQFPELAEPYNNLAALAANKNQWIEARDYLEMALKLKPTYAVALANLGEVYIRLGIQTYEEAAKAQTNQRQYSIRAKALQDILKPPPKPARATPTSSLPKP